MTIQNPLYEIWKEAQSMGFYNSHKTRWRAIKDFSYAVPNEEAIRTIISYGPVIEMGAGSGYWASLIKEAGGDVLACDEPHEEYIFNNQFFPVLEAGPEHVWAHPDRTLLLCWPPYENSFATDCLIAYNGDTVMFVGESYGGCTADDEFFELLDAEWERVEVVDIPQWVGVNDWLYVYKRK